MSFTPYSFNHKLSDFEDTFPQKCVLCGTTLNDFYESHNPFPASNEGRCCQSCNTSKVIPARIMLARRPKSILDDLV